MRFADLLGMAEDLRRMSYAPSRKPVEQARLARPRNWRLRLSRIDEEFPAEQNPGFAAKRSTAYPLQNISYRSVGQRREGAPVRLCALVP